MIPVLMLACFSSMSVVGMNASVKNETTGGSAGGAVSFRLVVTGDGTPDIQLNNNLPQSPFWIKGDKLTIHAHKFFVISSYDCKNVVGWYIAYIRYGHNVVFDKTEINFGNKEHANSYSCDDEDVTWSIGEDGTGNIELHFEGEYTVYNKAGEKICHKAWDKSTELNGKTKSVNHDNNLIMPFLNSYLKEIFQHNKLLRFLLKTLPVVR